jgi:hypothetical protein
MGPTWYNSNRTAETAGSDCYNCPGAQWTGESTTLTTYTYPLGALGAPSAVLFRIVFHSDQSVTDLGVNIDNFVILGTLSNQNFDLNNVWIYPNPSNGIFNIALGTIQPTGIEVYDLTGKIVYKQNEITVANFETKIDVSNLSPGIYFVKIINNDQATVKRIIKE